MKIVLHICCGICAIPVILKLTEEGHHVSGFFYNPNIHPLEEYERRLSATRTVCREFNLPLYVAPYDSEQWLKQTITLKNEPEGGARCPVCFRIRLEKTHEYMITTHSDCFTTTLTASRYKQSAIINRLGQELAEDKFLARDFKEDGHPDQTRHMVQQWGLYRQKYCGCIYSMPGLKFSKQTQDKAIKQRDII